MSQKPFLQPCAAQFPEEPELWYPAVIIGDKLPAKVDRKKAFHTKEEAADYAANLVEEFFSE